MPASPADVGRGGFFRGCNPIFRVAEPLCFIGIFRSPVDASTTVLLIPRSPDRVSLDRLRTTIGGPARSPGVNSVPLAGPPTGEGIRKQDSLGRQRVHPSRERI